MQKARGQAFRTEVRHSPPTACRHTVSGTVSLPSQGCFSPFPHGTGSLSVAREYLALRDGPRRFPRDFTCPAGTQGTRRSQLDVVYGAVTLYGRPFQTFRLSNRFVTPCDGPYNPAVHARRFGLFRVRSPLLAESLLFSLPGGTEMVHFPPLPSTAYGFS